MSGMATRTTSLTNIVQQGIRLARTRPDWFPAGVMANCEECGERVSVNGTLADVRKIPGQKVIRYYCDSCVAKAGAK